MALDELVPDDHRVRLVWAYVETLDLAPLYQTIRALPGSSGRNAVDPKILLALWMFATIEGVSSARHLARLCERDLPYRWLCGGVGVNYHLLSDFRSGQGEFLDQLLTDTIATLLHQQIVTLETVAQDGMRVRASAGTSSFRRKKTLEACQAEAAEQVRKLREEREATDDVSHKRREAARARAAAERQQRLEQALQELAQLQEQKEKKKRGTAENARSSTTDPEARKMKMADGGFRPAYNVQLASDGDARMIVAVDVTNNSSDGGQMAPLHEEVCRRYDTIPQRYLVDGGFATKDDITALEKQGSQVLAPILHEERMRSRGTDPHARQPGDSDEMFAFRQRMKTPEAKERYGTRPSIAEYPNAEFRNRGLQQFRVRGLKKVKAVALWHAVTFNLLRMLHLGCLPIG
jgi:transposase